MDYTWKNWAKTDIYNFAEEFNRIENYNEYCKTWLAYFGIIVTFTSKTDWVYIDIPDLNDINRIKNNINIILNAISSINSLNIDNSSVNQVFDYIKANEIDNALKSYLEIVCGWQFAYEITGLSICGNNLRIRGVS